jgi:hypothetical protein
LLPGYCNESKKGRMNCMYHNMCINTTRKCPDPGLRR